VYNRSLDKVVRCIESGTKGLHNILSECTQEFSAIKTDKSHRKPVVSVIGETYMRDNAFCNGNVVRRLEDLGIETLIGPFSEWITYSTYRFTRDSLWKMDMKGYLKSKIQGYAQDLSSAIILRGIKEVIDHEKHIPINEIMSLCNKYIDKDYDGDPPIAMGTATALVEKGISGIAAILPFTCMPGTLVAAVSDSFRKDHKNIPWINIAYDGQDTVTLETRLQAFAFQVKEFAKGASGKKEVTQIPKELTEQLLVDDIIADIHAPFV
jgi:predicted nucleotide-binding protein (sugar kinase/HSP70/actin superfamily)